MPLYLVERNFAEELGDAKDEDIQQIIDYNEDHDLRWLFSFLSADKRKSYCLYEAVDPDALRKHAADLGFPADVITELAPEMAEMLAKTSEIQHQPA